MTQQLYWAYVGFIDIADGNTRPVLYIRQTDTDYVVFRLSSQYENKSAFIPLAVKPRPSGRRYKAAIR